MSCLKRLMSIPPNFEVGLKQIADKFANQQRENFMRTIQQAIVESGSVNAATLADLTAKIDAQGKELSERVQVMDQNVQVLTNKLNSLQEEICKPSFLQSIAHEVLEALSRRGYAVNLEPKTEIQSTLESEFESALLEAPSVSEIDRAISSEEQIGNLAAKEVLTEQFSQPVLLSDTAHIRRALQCINLVSRIEQVLTNDEDTFQEINDELYRLRHHELPNLESLIQDSLLLTDIQMLLNPLVIKSSRDVTTGELEARTLELLLERYQQLHELNLQERILRHLL